MSVWVAKILGLALLAAGVAGFFSGHMLLIFGVSVPHNVVHLVSGAAGLWAGFAGASAARTFCLWFGLIYGLVAVLGYLNITAIVSLLNLNPADQVLHLAIAVVCLAAFGIDRARNR